MNFLVDAQLPRRIAVWLRSQGWDAVHTLDLPDRNRTTDAEVTARADLEGRVVVTKDDDFVQSHFHHGRPAKLLLIATGNINNRDLDDLLRRRMSDAVLLFAVHSFVQIDASGSLSTTRV